MEKPHVLVIGVGSIGLRHLECFEATGRVRLSICDMNAEFRDRACQKCKVEKCFDDFDKAIEESFDAAVIAVPANIHIPVSTRLAENGVHLLIEKPLSTSVEGIDALERIVTEKNLVAAVAYVYHCHPALAAMRRAITEGRFGEPVQVYVIGGQHFPTFRPAYRDIYFKDRKTGGGTIQDALTHLVNAAEWLVGPVTRLVSDAAHLMLDGVEAVEDTASLLTRHGNVLGTYMINQFQPANELSMTVVCNRGMARFETQPLRWRYCLEPGDPWVDQDFPTLERNDLFIAQANAFLDSIEKGTPPVCTLAEAFNTLKCNLAALESLEDRQWKAI